MGTRIISECEPMTMENEIRRDLKACIAHSGITQSEIAARMGCSKAYVSALLGGHKNLTLRSIVAIALAAGWVPSFKLVEMQEVDDDGIAPTALDIDNDCAP